MDVIWTDQSTCSKVGNAPHGWVGPTWGQAARSCIDARCPRLPAKVAQAADKRTRRPKVGETHRRLLMASCDSLSEADLAVSRGWRATVVLERGETRPKLRTPGGNLVMVCPAQRHPGKVTCNGGKDSLACGNGKPWCSPEHNPGFVVGFVEHGPNPLLELCYAWAGTPAMGYASLLKAVARGADRSLERALRLRHKLARVVRLGAIGDPGSIPARKLEAIARKVKAAGLALIGYTHNWR